MERTMNKQALQIGAIFGLALLAGGCNRGSDPRTSPRHQVTAGAVAVVARSQTPRFAVETNRDPTAKVALRLASDRDKQRIFSGYGQLPLSFEANRGQLDPGVQFISRLRGSMLFLTASEAVLALRARREQDFAAQGFRPRWLPMQRDPRASVRRYKSDVLRMQLVGSNPDAMVNGRDELPSKSNYFLGSDPDQWHTGVANYARVEYENIYPGVNLVYRGTQRQLEYDFIVAPGYNPTIILLAFPGTSGIRIDARGDLILSPSSSSVKLRKPVIYQGTGGSRRVIPGRYVLRGRDEVGFEIAAYDTNKTLIIDPSLSYSTYLGGGADDSATSIAVDASGNAYVTGSTSSTDFPTSSPLQSANRGKNDIFVAKLNAAGNALVYSTYLGGSDDDSATNIAVDAVGSAYVTGETVSGDFPTKNPIQAANAGSEDSFVTKLDSTGAALVYSTFLGGSGNDFGTSIALDSAGNAYVAGFTRSTDFPVVSPLQMTNHGNEDAFVAKLNAAGSALVYSTFLGGGGLDIAHAITVDGSGNAYAAGSTTSKDFPTTAGAFDLTCGTNQGKCGDFYYYVITDAWVAKINATGSTLAYSTFLGGGADDVALGIAVDPTGNAYVTGLTASNDFPTQNPAQKASGGLDAFLTKLNVDGSGLVYSTFLGGTNFDQGVAIALDSSGNAYVSGTTGSTDFPVKSSFQATLGGRADAFITKFDAAGALAYSSYLGGLGDESEGGNPLAIDSSGNVYLAGITNSSNFPTKNPLQANLGGGTDAFVVKISPAAATGADLSVAIAASPDPGTTGGQLTYTITVANHGPQDATGVQLTDTLAAGVSFTSSAPSQGSCTGAAPVICDLGALKNGSTANVTIMVTTPNPGVFTDKANLSGNEADSSAGNNQAAVNTTVNADFAVQIAPPSVTVMAGSSAGYTVTVGALNGPFISDVSMTCSVTPALSCQLGATSVNPGPDPNSPTTFPLTIVTVRRSATLTPVGSAHRGPILGIWLVLPGIALSGIGVWVDKSKKRRLLCRLRFIALVALLGLQAACGGGSSGGGSSGGGSSGTPAGTYQIKITGGSGAIQHSATASLVVQ
jgi:uncharacterized repeat protein (TIGR01451 family)